MVAQDLVGQRIKAIRRQRGLSQAQLAHPELSDSYVSLIESGKRTPTPAVLELLAQKLDCSLTYLVNGVTAEQMQELEVGLSFARMALENGEVEEASRRFAELLADNSLAGLVSLRQDAQYGYALALEACGELAEAIAVLSELRESETVPAERKIAVALAMCRCHRERGDFSAAVQVGEAVLADVGSGGWTDGLVELGATLLLAYLVRGDLMRAGHFAAELLVAAEGLGSPRANVASCWNAALVAEKAGRGEEAMSLIERALAIHSETGDQRNLARLHQAYAFTMLRVRPSDVEKARDLLLRAARDYEETATSMSDKARCSLSLAYAELTLDHPEDAAEHASAARDLMNESAGGLNLDAYLLLSQAHHLLHRDEESDAELSQVSTWLEGSPQTRKLAEKWMAVAELRDRAGNPDLSVAAYQKALACAGL
ncbi:helix-turn-helix domain-containing protein [Planotetraspora kaengkrachanensis]|uniref:HTH cro/C1-type domain-containing protein n=1 Tax=Planotetraspora kaengkrachanensis TaxID=575193 RepID=A0A8J3LVH0_9ACTN|nr:helix-turn-helix transcriptional regulator [Planotetraspora kaengkrachanensis]GIG77263.1 hypothetical protein Pka01_03900 [Planotetraspora kaengkrachanensis]